MYILYICGGGCAHGTKGATASEITRKFIRHLFFWMRQRNDFKTNELSDAKAARLLLHFYII